MSTPFCQTHLLAEPWQRVAINKIPPSMYARPSFCCDLAADEGEKEEEAAAEKEQAEEEEQQWEEGERQNTRVFMDGRVADRLPVSRALFMYRLCRSTRLFKRQQLQEPAPPPPIENKAGRNITPAAAFMRFFNSPDPV